MINKLLCLCFSAIILAACGQQPSQQSGSDNTAGNTINQKAEVKNENLEQVLDRYLELKDALVASDPAKAQETGASLSLALANVKGCENTAKVAQQIADSANLKDQRKNFTILSADIIPLITNSERPDSPVYIQFCPMANDGDGGYWLASETQIRNPYYGDEMLKCGKVVEEFRHGLK